MLKVGLTGSIAVGKSFVCEIFRELGCHVLDADQTAREVVMPGTAGFMRIISEFGETVVGPDGTLDRKKLGKIVFADPEKRRLLNSIVHPLVIEQQDRWLNAVEADDPKGVAIVDAALMIESGGYKRFDQLIVVWCEPEVQLKRLMARDGINEEDARRRIISQMPQDEKKAFADHLIDTSQGREDTRSQAIAIHQILLEHVGKIH